MTRAEHLDWAKQRALEYVERDDIPNAVASLISDCGKHPELQGVPSTESFSALLFGHRKATAEAARRWIEEVK